MSNAQTTAETALHSAMQTDVGRKIVVSKVIALSKETHHLRRKVAEDRIAVHALNHLSILLIRLMDRDFRLFNEHKIPMDKTTLQIVREIEHFRMENFTQEMICRIEAILEDTEGDDILLRDLIGKQPEEVKQ
jgi:hypothetical protein